MRSNDQDCTNADAGSSFHFASLRNLCLGKISEILLRKFPHGFEHRLASI